MIDIKTEQNLIDLIRNIDKLDRDDLKRFASKHEHSGLDVFAAPSLLDWRKVDANDIRRVLEVLSAHYDKIVLDTSGTLNEISEVAIEMATMVLWVTTTEFASVRDSIEALRTLRELSYPQERVRLVVNSIFTDDSVRASAVQDALQQTIFWQVPYEKKVRQGTHLGQPVVITAPQTVASRSFAGLATAISGGRPDQGRNQPGMFKWRATQPAAAGRAVVMAIELRSVRGNARHDAVPESDWR